MKEPTKYSMSTGKPVEKDESRIPMPSLYPEPMSNDVYSSSNKENEFWNFIAKQEQSRKEWQKSKDNS